jgi:hypothetical protein
MAKRGADYETAPRLLFEIETQVFGGGSLAAVSSFETIPAPVLGGGSLTRVFGGGSLGFGISGSFPSSDISSLLGFGR